MFFDSETGAYIEADEAPKLKTVKYNIENPNPAFPVTIASKKDVIVKPKDRAKLFQHFSAENVHEFNTGRCVVNEITHSYNNAEYSAEGNRFYFSVRQISYMRTHMDADVKIAVYGLERNKEAAPDFIQEAFTPDTSKYKPFNFSLPKTIEVELFEKPELHEIDKTMELLYINLPFEFYQNIFIPAKVYYYDMDNDKTYLCFYPFNEDGTLDCSTHDDMDNRGEDIKPVMNNKISPIAMKMEDSCIVSVGNYASLIYAIAAKLPYISAIIAIGNHSCEYERMTPRRLDKEVFNKTFYPFFQV